MKRFIRLVWPYILCALFVSAVLWSAMLMVGCTTTKFVEVEKVVKDTTYITKQQRDSVWLHDSVFVALTGDTLRIEKWHTKYIERLRTDTVYRSRIDSVPVPYAVEKYIEKKLSWWQKTKMNLGLVFVGLLVAAAAYGIYRLRRMFL